MMHQTVEIKWGNSGAEPSQITHQLLPHITPNSGVRPGTVDVSLESYLAAPQDQAEVTRTRGVVNNVGHSIADIVETVNRSSGCINQTFQAIVEWIEAMEQQFEEMKKVQQTRLMHRSALKTNQFRRLGQCSGLSSFQRIKLNSVTGPTGWFML